MSAARIGVGRVHEAGLVRENDGLDAVAQLEFLQDVRDVGLDGPLADEELVGDLGVGQAAGEKFEDLELARGSSCSAAGGVGRGMRVNWRMTRSVTAGDRRASRAATVRIAASSCSGGSSLRTNPLAPALSASYMYSSRSKVVRIRTRADALAARTARIPRPWRVLDRPGGFDGRVPHRDSSPCANQHGGRGEASSPRLPLSAWCRGED